MEKEMGQQESGDNGQQEGMNSIVFHVITIPTMYKKHRAIKMKDKTS